MDGGPTKLIRALVATGAAFLVAAFIAGYASRALFNPDQFADRAAAALENEGVADEIGARTVDGLVALAPNLIAVRPVLEGVTVAIVRGSAFQATFRAGVSDLHRAFFERDEDTVVFALADVGATVSGALRALDPRLAAKIPTRGSAIVLDGEVPGLAASLLQAADAASWLPWALLGIALALIATALAMSRDRRVVALTTGVSMLVVSAVALMGLRVANVVALGAVDDQAGRDFLQGVWDAFLGDLGTGLLLVAGCGAVVAAAASSLLRPVDLRTRLESIGEVAARVPERGYLRAARAVALVALGVLVVTHSGLFVSVLVTAIGLGIAYAGVAELMQMTIAADPDQGSSREGRRVLMAAAVTGVAVVVAGAIFVRAGGVTQEGLAIETVGCNGAEVLCERPYDEVATAATHNSMSAATYPGWNFAQQERGITAQLRAGVRGLLIDAHPGIGTKDGTIKTDLSGADGGERAKLEDALGERAVGAALRTRDRIIGSPEVGEPGVYLCHAFCELGAITLDQGFGEIHDFVAANPDEVVTVVIEDYVPPAEIAAAAERTGLLDFVYTGRVGVPWPTLGEIIDSGGRVLLMAENEAGGTEYPWYHPVYESLVQETPFSFGRPAQLVDPEDLEASCAPNRGPSSARVFLINHWIDTSPAPRPSNAKVVNRRSALVDRIHRCERQRDLLATLVAIDFYEEGDVFGAVAALNAER